jgi:Protein of unknown function (DUF3060)
MASTTVEMPLIKSARFFNQYRAKIRLALIGRDNVVELDRVGTIALVGADNQVSYLGGLNSNPPTIDRVGKDNG